MDSARIITDEQPGQDAGIAGAHVSLGRANVRSAIMGRIVPAMKQQTPGTLGYPDRGGPFPVCSDGRRTRPGLPSAQR